MNGIFSVAHNIPTMNTQRSLAANQSRLMKTIEKLSSGLRINRAADNAAGLAISEGMRRQINGWNQGTNNIRDGLGLIATAEGALSEVHSMLQRMSSLAVQSANGTYSEEAREGIKKEIQELKKEIDRISNETHFNNVHMLNAVSATGVLKKNENGEEKEVDFNVYDLKLREDFISDMPACGLKLLADVEKEDIKSTWHLVYADGGTSYTSFRVNYELNGETREDVVKFQDYGIEYDDDDNGIGTDYSLHPGKLQQVSFSSSPGIQTRTYSYQNRDGLQLLLSQNVRRADDMRFDISYTIQNQSDFDISADILVHYDTAIDSNDEFDSYFIDGTQEQYAGIYRKPSVASAMPTDGGGYVRDNVPSSLSIFNLQGTLPFTEKLYFDGSTDAVSVGNWYENIHEWSYYDNGNQYLGHGMSSGTVTRVVDTAVAMLWMGKQLQAHGGSYTSSLGFGIEPVEYDENMLGVEGIPRENEGIWIQTSAEAGDGLSIKKINTGTAALKLSSMSLKTQQTAENAIEALREAINTISKYRSALGASYNALEHILNYRDVQSENLTAAESRIRDTDMAKEIADFSKGQILVQASQSMLAQANAKSESVLGLISR